MSLVLNIDTSLETASVSIAMNGKILHATTNTVQKNHAAFLHPGIKHVLHLAGKHITEIDAVAVTSGPGSYTGIRVGMSCAKGLCMALIKPFITINTLELLAKDALIYNMQADTLYCPMIDARRMEVYTALYDQSFNMVLKPCAMIIDKNFFSEYIQYNPVMFFGNGSIKLKDFASIQNYCIIENVNIPSSLALLSFELFSNKSFTDLIYSEPTYVKDFYTGT